VRNQNELIEWHKQEQCTTLCVEIAIEHSCNTHILLNK